MRFDSDFIDHTKIFYIQTNLKANIKRYQLNPYNSNYNFQFPG